MILCGERDYTGPQDFILMNYPLVLDERIPLASLTDKYNITSLPINIYFEENLNLMKQLIPEMKKVLYIGDETYICQQNDYDLSRVIAEKYPEPDYRFLCARDIGINSHFSILKKVDSKTTGVLFSSWFRKKYIQIIQFCLPILTVSLLLLRFLFSHLKI